MNVGITILVIIGVVILSQLLVQGSDWRKEHREILARLDLLESKYGHRWQAPVSRACARRSQDLFECALPETRRPDYLLAALRKEWQGDLGP
jgi:hypothetical protein